MDSPETNEATGTKSVLPWQTRAPPALQLDVLEDLDLRGEFDERDFDTPRETGAAPLCEGLPTSPTQRKTKSRAAHAICRNSSFTSRNSLKDSKVLMVTGMKRSDSLQQPDLFRYHDHFEFMGVVGRTHLSEVFRVQHRHTGELFAVKRSRRRFKSKLHRERCLREISAVAALPAHPNIVGQYRAWQEGGHFYIQMDLCEGGNLQQLIVAATAEGSLLSDEELWTVLWEVASGLEFLHVHGVLHLDIKPENIYRNANGVCQIGDFGLAVSVETKEWWEEGDGDYVAPELLKTNGVPCPAADIYSLGVTLYECATGIKLMRALPSDSSPAEATLPGRPHALQALMRWMLHPDPSQRPTATQVLRYIQGQGAVLLVTDPNGTAAYCSDGVPEAGSTANTPTAAATPSRAKTCGGLASPLECGTKVEEGEEAAQQQQELHFPSPMVELSQESSGEELPAAVSPQPQQPFSFARLTPHLSVRKLPPPGWHHGAAAAAGAAEGVADGDGNSTATTPLARQSFRRGSRAGGLSAAVAKRAAAAVGGLQRWVPSLSPLISEGALTPGALTRLSPFSAVKGNAPKDDVTMRSRGSTPGSAPHTHSTPGSPMPSPVPGVQCREHSTDSREGWRLSRRDIISPDSDALARSVTESDLYSFSCGTGGTVSSLEFMDTGCPSQPNSPEFQSAAPPEPQATPEFFSRAQPPMLAAAAASAFAQGACEEGRVSHPAAAPASLAWDLHTSPEFLMQLPPGSPVSPSSTVEESLPSRSLSIRRFPTLDSMESMQLDGSCQLLVATVAGAKGAIPTKPRRISSFSSIPPRLTSTFGEPVAEASGGAGDPVQARKRPLSRHNSRRGLMTVLSREGSLASCGSLDQTELAQRMRRDSWAADLPKDCDAREEGVAATGHNVPAWARGLRSSSGCLQQPGKPPLPFAAGAPPAAPGKAQQPSPLRSGITGPALGEGSTGCVH